MRYKRPNRRRHKPYSAKTQAFALAICVGLLLAPFTYCISLLVALLLASTLLGRE